MIMSMRMNDVGSSVASEFLPESAQTLIAVIGYSATLRLVTELGGTTLHARTNERSGRDGGVYALLDGVLSDSEIEALMRHVGGAPFYIPRCDGAVRKMRNARFIEEIHRVKASLGSYRKAMAALCPKYGFSDRYGWKLLSQ